MRNEHWKAIETCDTDYDGRFVYAVTTTGIFCRPSCKSKTPKRDNVKTFASAGDALRAGFRPCKRCRPELTGGFTPTQRLIEEATELISTHYAEDLTLREIAERLFVSPFHLQRLFKQTLGVSPTRFLALRRLDAAKVILTKTDSSVTAVALSVGFKNPAHFASVFRREVGCRPTAYRLASREPYGPQRPPHKSASQPTCSRASDSI